ncbi:MAG TPA: S41 family peptidase [Phototrophicaceae bacterium]|jgi:carboxyl-terminal processing protease|nr:S41 family peptidase [Phototrophicaceae bacterium]
MNSRFRDYGRSLALGALAGIVMAAIFAAGFFTRELVDLPVLTQASGDNFPLLNEVEALLEHYYLRQIPDATMRQYAAIRGVMDTLGDHNTFFIEPPVAQSESDALAGTYGGIGVQLQRSTTGEYILFPFDDSPAEKAGIKEGDLLIRVNDIDVSGSIQQDAVDQMLRGEVKAGNGVKITIRRENETEETALFIEFGVINVPSVIWRVLPEDNRIGYIHILRFTNRTPDEVTQALQKLRIAGIQGLILDLRDNGGGLLQESVKVAGQFLDGGVVLYEKTNKNEKTFTADTGGLMTDLPMTVLVNQWTASAAELVAGALEDRGRGILIGQKTYGKGTIQQIFELSDKSSIHITAAEWFTPEHRALDGVGLEPGIPVEPDSSGRDLELLQAMDYLQGKFTTTKDLSS